MPILRSGLLYDSSSISILCVDRMTHHQSHGISIKIPYRASLDMSRLTDELISYFTFCPFNEHCFVSSN